MTKPGFLFVAILLLTPLVVTAQPRVRWPDPRPIDQQRLQAAGLRVVESDRCTLVTDAAPSPRIDELPRLIDLALSQWVSRFGAGRGGGDRVGVPNWRLRAYLVIDRARFESLGLWPNQQQEFPHGLAVGHEVWLYQQSSDYYLRHLFLHEATHAYMATRLGGCGPGWYMEGTAELCGTHRWDAARNRLELAVFPANRAEAPMWGRVRLIRDAVASGAALPIEAVTRIDNQDRLPPTSYAWVWALARFLNDHPRYNKRFSRLSDWVLEDNFNQRFSRAYADDRERLDQEWRLFCHTLAYGHDLSREAIEFREGSPLVSGEQTVAVRADRGWQSSGIRVQQGAEYQLSSEGRFVIAREPDGAPWPSEAGGVTLEYHGGRPLGELLATVDAGPRAFLEPIPIGLSGVFEAEASGTLYLRVNDAPNRLADNSDGLRVTVRVD